MNHPSQRDRGHAPDPSTPSRRATATPAASSSSVPSSRTRPAIATPRNTSTITALPQTGRFQGFARAEDFDVATESAPPSPTRTAPNSNELAMIKSLYDLHFGELAPRTPVPAPASPSIRVSSPGRVLKPYLLSCVQQFNANDFAPQFLDEDFPSEPKTPPQQHASLPRVQPSAAHLGARSVPPSPAVGMARAHRFNPQSLAATRGWDTVCLLAQWAFEIRDDGRDELDTPGVTHSDYWEDTAFRKAARASILRLVTDLVSSFNFMLSSSR